MPDFDRDRLLMYFRSLDAPDQGRRLAAARGIAQFVKTAGLEWDDIIVKPEVVAGKAVPPAPIWPHVTFVTSLSARHAAGEIKLSQWEQEFCKNLAEWKRPPSVKQNEVLDRMREKFVTGWGSHVNTTAALASIHGPQGWTVVPGAFP